MALTGFHQRCEALFSGKLSYGRRWKTAAAQALSISRATLYRYFEDDSAIAADVLHRLVELEAGGNSVASDRELVTRYARGLVDVQMQIDEYGWLKQGYPATLQRSFDVAAARNVHLGEDRWPTSFAALTRLAAKPLFEWVSDLSWDPEGEFTATALLDDGEITPSCLDLAMPGKDPEAELVENAGYTLIRGICAERRDGQDVYVAFRRAVIENPVLSSWTATLLTDPVLATIDRIDEIVDAFYQPIPEAMVVDGFLPICTVSGTILRKETSGFHTESRDPDAIRRARSGECKKVKWRPGFKHLRRAFRLYWCLPGKAELELERQLTQADWTCTLWPNLDRVDLSAVSPNHARRIAADVKDYLSPEHLAARFAGFKEYAHDYDCFVVVPDYMPEISRGYERRFEAARASYSKGSVTLRTVSGLLGDLEISG